MPELFYTADDVAKLLSSSWEVVFMDARPRSATTSDGIEFTIHDAVMRAKRVTGRSRPNRLVFR